MRHVRQSTRSISAPSPADLSQNSNLTTTTNGRRTLLSLSYSYTDSTYVSIFSNKMIVIGKCTVMVGAVQTRHDHLE